MLNTATWSNSHGRGTALSLKTLATDIDPLETFELIPAMSLTRPSKPLKPYVYGLHLSAAERIREQWNQLHPRNPMP